MLRERAETHHLHGRTLEAIQTILEAVNAPSNADRLSDQKRLCLYLYARGDYASW